MVVYKTPFLPCQNQICFQQAVVVHVGLNANELCDPAPLFRGKTSRL